LPQKAAEIGQQIQSLLSNLLIKRSWPDTSPGPGQRPFYRECSRSSTSGAFAPCLEPLYKQSPQTKSPLPNYHAFPDSSPSHRVILIVGDSADETSPVVLNLLALRGNKVFLSANTVLPVTATSTLPGGVVL